MVFSSVIFVLFFLPIVLAGYFLLVAPALLGSRSRFWWQASNAFLLFSSLVFYFWGERSLTWIIIGSILINYVCGLIISGAYRSGGVQQLVPGGPRNWRQKAGLVAAVACNLGILGLFKYFNFGVENFNGLMARLGLSGLFWHDAIRITLPLGISFYTFQAMSYTIDVYRGRTRATRNLVDFACYVTMFPQLVAGPIVRYLDIAEQLRSREITCRLFASGVSRFVVGLAKKLLIANTVSVAAEEIFALPTANLSPGIAWFGALCFALQIYFDFSGYSDMAIGLGRMLGFSFPENFNYPYISQSMREFWQRWHISLSTWFRDYLYIPLGGNRRSPGRTYMNLALVFTLCGLWHGASWTFVVWGLYHGFFLVLERIGLQEFLARRHPLIRHVYTLLTILCGWVIFASPTIGHAAGFLTAMVGVAADAVSTQDLEWYMTREVRIALIAGVVFSMPVVPAFVASIRRAVAELGGVARSAAEWTLAVCRLLCLSALYVLCVMFLSAGTHNPFIYFRF
ncbi:MAG: MBOAT family protein [Phycisphaerales bacterium]